MAFRRNALQGEKGTAVIDRRYKGLEMREPGRCSHEREFVDPLIPRTHVRGYMGD